MVKSLLPPLNEDNAVPLPSTHGKWVSDENSILGRISNGLKDITIEQEIEDLISIPDVWARVSVVKNALFDDKHPLNYTVRGEWRGLLSLFALMPYHEKNIETVPVNLKSLKENPYQVPPNEEGIAGNFAEVLSTITPGLIIAKGQNWEEIGLIKLDGKPIGLLVPNTIISPARYYSESISSGIDWFQTGKFIDPCEAANIQSEQFLVLIKFLDDMINGLHQTTMEDKFNFDGILGELNLFKEDCQSRIGSNQSSSIEIANYKRYNVVLRVPQQPIYPLLQNIYEFDTGGKIAFDTLLKVRPELNNLIKGIILIDDEIPNGIGKTASSIRIWNTTTVEGIINDKKIENKIIKEITNEGYLHLKPDELFTKKICLPFSSEKISNHNDLLAKPYLLPFNPIVLSFMTTSQLRNNFDIKDSGSSYNVSLRLELINHLGTKTEYTIRKEYLKENIENRLELPLSAHIWPNFKHPSWKQYFLMYTCNLQTSIGLRSVFSIEGLLDQLNTLSNQDQKIKLLNELKDNSVKMSNRLPLEETTNTKELHLTEQPPEALICDASLNLDLHEFVPSNEREAMGIIISTKPQDIMINNDEYKFGIDFGTTNTCAYMRINEEIPKEITFNNRLYSPFSGTADNEAVDYELRDFLPERDINLPFLTISRDRNIGKNQGDINIPLPIWRAIIYYVSDIRDGLADIVDARQRVLHFNLKWSKATADRQRIEIYLSQVILQCIAEGLAKGADFDKIGWNFSYPEAFTPVQLRNFRALFRGGLKKALTPFDINNDKNLNIDYKSESLSSALYFASYKGAAFVDSVITIDIGGHTSDISIWQDRNLLWRNSATIAGRHILINFLTQNPTLIESLSSNHPIMRAAYDNYMSEIIKSGDPIAIRNGIEVIVNSADFAEAISSQFHMVDGQDNGRNLRLIAELALGGILFYAGQMVDHLQKQKLYNTRHSKVISICLGGRASLLYKVLFSDKDDQDGLCQLFSKATNGAVDVNTVNFVFTEKPKHEVSHGLLVAQKGIANLDVSKRCYDVLIGEDIDVGGEIVSYNQSVHSLDLNKDWRAINLTNLKLFADILKETTGIVFEVSRQVENMIVSKINTNLVAAQEELLDAQKDGLDHLASDMKGESSIIEPPFIIAIKEILERVSKNEINLLSKNR